MNLIKWVVIGCRVLTVGFGLTLLASGCGGNPDQETGKTPDIQREMQRLEESKKAMEAASKAQK
jgi:hypothetical protein